MNLRILIDIGHPAQVHLFKHFAWEMQRRGCNLFFTGRDKDRSMELLKTYGLPYYVTGAHCSSVITKVYSLFKNGPLFYKFV